MKQFAINVISLSLLLVFFGCGNNKQTTPVVDEPVARFSIEELLDPTINPDISIVNKKDVRAFYQSKDFTPVWSMQDSLLAEADSLIQFIYNSPFYGLFPDTYHAREIKAALESKKADQLIALDVLLTDSFISLWEHLKYGRKNPAHAKDSLEDVPIENAIRENNVVRYLKSREPQNEEYKYLKAFLSGMLHKREHDHVVVIADTIQTLFSNLERWRWDAPFPDRYIFVNVPSYTMKVIDKNENVLESKVIVGKPETPTHRITSLIERFTIYPYWHIPRKIAVGEMLPVIQKDTSYIRKNNLDVLDRNGNLLKPSQVKWKTFHEDYFPVILRQREGADNSLGVIKFQFKNPYAIYLHDTNAKRLFREDYRALSHGCVRVEKARDLAYYLVQDDSILCTPDDLTQYLEIKHRMDIDIVNPISIFIRYFTAEANADTLKIYEDLYKMDGEN
ncbi:MAG TPA: L,D-transpeptidase family protein [Cyclobacteriaceae bacterium]|nr:L,D-transpeptidase family protein [Cyclobacteriaceae bacterium]